VKIRLKDNTVKEYPAGMSVLDIAKDISQGLARAAMAAEVNGTTADLRKEIVEDSDLNILTFEDLEGRKAFWHTSSHIMAQAVKRLFPEAKLAIGPAIDNGFYYDFDVERPFSTEDLEAIE
jgi:threonyl-tRNA synthetase